MTKIIVDDFNFKLKTVFNDFSFKLKFKVVVVNYDFMFLKNLKSELLIMVLREKKKKKKLSPCGCPSHSDALVGTILGWFILWKNFFSTSYFGSKPRLASVGR